MNIDWKDRLFLKITSGRFLIAVAITIGFVILSIQGRLTADYTNIFLIIITFYFSKDSEKNTNHSNKLD